MFCRAQLLLLGLLLLQLSLTACAQAKTFAISSDLLQSALRPDLPPPVTVEPASYEEDTVELCFQETALCPEMAVEDPNDDGAISYVFDDNFVSEFSCSSKEEGKRRETDFLLERQQPAGFCTLTNRAVPLPFPASILLAALGGGIDPGSLIFNGLPLPSSSSVEQRFNFKFSATCVLKKHAHDACSLEGFEGAVLDISGLSVQETTLVIDRDPRQPPALKCAGQSLLTYYDGFLLRTTAPRNGTTAPEDLRQRMSWVPSTVAKRRAQKDAGKGAKSTTPAPAASSDKGTPAAAAMHGPSDGHRHHDNDGGAAAAPPRTYFQGPGKIYSGVVYAHDPHGKGLIATGLFEYVRPQFVPAALIDDDLGDYGFTKLTAAPEGKKVYTPWEYIFKLTRGSLQKDQAYPPYGRA